MYGVANPADGDWIYYILDVRTGDGSSLFTNDYGRVRRRPRSGAWQPDSVAEDGLG